MNNSRYLIFSSVMSIKYLPGLFSLALYLTSGSSFSKSISRPTAFLVILSKFSKPVLMSVTCCWRIESISKFILSLWMLLSVICFCVIALFANASFCLALGSLSLSVRLYFFLNLENVALFTSNSCFFVFNSSEFPCCSLTSCSSWWFPLRAALENNVYLNLLGSWWWFSYKSLNSFQVPVFFLQLICILFVSWFFHNLDCCVLMLMFPVHCR